MEDGIPAILREAGSERDGFEAIVLSLLLVNGRILAFLAVSPFFGRRAMPRTVRVGVGLALSIIMVPSVFGQILELEDPIGVVATLLLKEALLGLLLGMLVWLPVRGIEFAGVLFDTQRGSTMAQDFDVIFNAQVTPTAILLAQIFSGFFFASGGFLMVQMLIFNSFEIWPPVEMLPPLTEGVAILFAEYTALLLFLAVIIALPVVGFMFLADVAIAFLARSAPTINALTFAMPVKSAILAIVLLGYIPVAFDKVWDTFREALTVTERVLSGER